MKKKITGKCLSVMLKAAWKLAKLGVKKYGGKAKDYIAESMKIVWERTIQFNEA